MNPTRPSASVALATLAATAALLTASCGSSSTPKPASTSEPAPVVSSAVSRSELRERAIDTLTTAVQSPVPQMRANAIEGMLQAPTRLESLVALGLKDENLGVRSVAAMCVGRAKLRTLAPAVSPLLSDQSAFVRLSANYALMRLNESSDPNAIATALLSDPSPRVRAHAAYVLGELGNKSATGMLRQALLEKNPLASAEEVRLMQLQVAEALVKLGDTAQVQTVRAALYPSRPQELEAAALAVQIIGEVKDRGAIDQLIYLDAYTDETGQRMPAEIRLALASALAKMGMREGSYIAEEFKDSPIPAIRAQVASVFGETGQNANLTPLAVLLEDPEGNVRVAAAAAILKITSR